MTWEIIHSSAQEIDVRLSHPIDRWDTLLDEIRDCLKGGHVAVRLPRELPGAPGAEVEMLQMLRRILVAGGATLLPAAERVR